MGIGENEEKNNWHDEVGSQRCGHAAPKYHKIIFDSFSGILPCLNSFSTLALLKLILLSLAGKLADKHLTYPLHILDHVLPPYSYLIHFQI